MIAAAVAGVALILASGFAWAAEETHALSAGSFAGLSVVLAMLIASVHLCGDYVHAWLFRREDIARSFGSGMAVAYLCVQLMPELNRASDEFGHRIYLLALAGFLLFYSLAYLATRRVEEDQEHRRGMLPVHLGFMTVYTWSIVYSAPEIAELHGVLATFVVCIALALHILSSDHGLAEHYGPHFRMRHRMLLALGALAAGAMDYVVPPSPEVGAIAVALVTGFLMFATLNEELPEPEKSNLPMFILGAITLAGLLELAVRL